MYRIFAIVTLVSASHIGFSNLPLVDFVNNCLYAAASFKIIPSTTKLMFIIQFMFNSSASIDLVFKELKNLKLN